MCIIKIIFCRLYTTERFCASLSVDHFYELPTYHCRSLLFSSQKYIPSYLGEDQVDWSVDVYPKGEDLYIFKDRPEKKRQIKSAKSLTRKCY